ncbi:Lrp/AsnC family transcriptional regulator [Brevibacillus centrosporus]|uniref:Lrp/AsnC family transcriptional regulator, leucine-responsive regulatory protein n=1 Tax=Brevibacillus centrosporus TaxID=54910 RepID=A0A1I3VHA1_9BACL|nr:Lrp/AsnC family transcriptional regulator [Brevibacillus centrosporus]MEC2130857.1 Lrp/AsnC family transcriptional regulator [Brevibacillus centrosporus]MED4908046.1 Lrp/AsnC family transcriptional regulator [Brevibacillus centrosporus]RNB69124.1 Lrp/AsnC family transcriptional regulator [Brevibacillus centrosporus]SFJ94748.1 Lrp/AsnC family transcriptional regulator, leucine-responsive regulatory protein [Brevibacillus centrosporus]GED31416.1 AsnC family transcriptional regulator [Brevibac
MDHIDQEILQLLKNNGRMTSSEISRQVHLSVPAVSERIRKLEESAVIDRFTVKLNREQLGQQLLAFIMVQLEKPEHVEEFRKVILQADSVLECHHMAGAYDYMLKVALSGTKELERLISDTIKQVPGVVKTNTMIVLSSMKEEM